MALGFSCKGVGERKNARSKGGEGNLYGVGERKTALSKVERGTCMIKGETCVPRPPMFSFCGNLTFCTQLPAQSIV
jgi:hypothetical protein